MEHFRTAADPNIATEDIYGRYRDETASSPLKPLLRRESIISFLLRVYRKIAKSFYRCISIYFTCDRFKAPPADGDMEAKSFHSYTESPELPLEHHDPRLQIVQGQGDDAGDF